MRARLRGLDGREGMLRQEGLCLAYPLSGLRGFGVGEFLRLLVGEAAGESAEPQRGPNRKERRHAL